MAAVLGLLLLLAACSLFWPQREMSELENRPLASRPRLSLDSVGSGVFSNQAERSLSDQFPLREFWLSVNSIYDMALLKAERNRILIGKGGRLFEPAAALKTQTLFDNADAAAKLRAASGLEVWLMLIPMASGVHEQDLPLFYQADDQQALLDEAFRRSLAFPVDVLSAMRGRRDEEFFYRTDHHWTAAGARVAYEALAGHWNLVPAIPSSRLSVQGFLGTLAARAASPFIPSETLSFDLYEGLDLYIGENKADGLFDQAQLEKRDKYAALLYGSTEGIITLNNQKAQGSLLVIRDSYANALLPALGKHFNRVIAVDPRYYRGDILELCKQEGVERILCIYGLSTWLNDRNLPAAASDWLP
jgi:hypothetical protein